MRAVYRLALRQAEGLIRSIFTLLGLALPVPDHTTLSRRGRVLCLDLRATAGSGLDLAIGCLAEQPVRRGQPSFSMAESDPGH